VEVARSMRDAIEESAAAAEEEEGFEPGSASADAAAGARRPAKEEETVGRGMAAIRGDRRKEDPFVRRRTGEAVMLDRISSLCTGPSRSRTPSGCRFIRGRLINSSNSIA